MFRGIACGFWSPFAHRGVPQMRDEHLHAPLLRVPDELVDVVEAVRRVEGVGCVRGARRRHLVPLDQRPQDRRFVRARQVHRVRAGPVEAQLGIVVEADPHAVGSRSGRSEHGGCEAGEDEQAGDESHEGSSLRGDGSGHASPTALGRCEVRVHALLSPSVPRTPVGRRSDRVDSVVPMVWEAVFMLVLLKIPIVYLCMVVWWAIRAEPRDEQPAAQRARLRHADLAVWLDAPAVVPVAGPGPSAPRAAAPPRGRRRPR